MRRALLVTAIFIMTGFQCALAMELEELLKILASKPERVAHFTETRTASFLETPLLSEGSLEYKAPATMIKRIIYPEVIEQRVEGDVLSIYQGEDLMRTISLASNPELAAGINAIRWVLSGNLAALSQTYNVTLVSNEPLWSITLAPKDHDVIAGISSIILTGKDDHITRIEIRQSNGDLIITVLNESR